MTNSEKGIQEVKENMARIEAMIEQMKPKVSLLDTYALDKVLEIKNTTLALEDMGFLLDNNPLPKELRGRPVKPVVSFEKKVGRNELCSCGSGYKTKKCKCKK